MFSKLRHKEESEIECSICKNKFKHRKNLYFHVRKVHKSEPLSRIKEHECEECKKMYTSKHSLNIHMKTMHKVAPNRHEVECDFKCSICKTKFKHRKSLYYHIRNKHKLEPLSQTKEHECKQCKKKFSVANTLSAHMRTVHKIAPNRLKEECDVECSLCETKFRHRKSLYYHIRNVHKLEPLSRIREHECQECKKKFTAKTSLYTHMRTIHKTVSKFSDLNNDHNYVGRASKRPQLTCPFEGCSKQYSRYNVLLEHLEHQHNFIVEIEEHTFSSFLEFETWKNKMQKETSSSYVQDSGIKKLSGTGIRNALQGNMQLQGTKDQDLFKTMPTSGIRKKYYSCSRSYHYDPPSERKRKRNMKIMCSNKINKPCPSRLEVTISDTNGNLQLCAKLWKTHYGHTDLAGRIYLDKVTRATIADQEVMDITGNDVDDDFKTLKEMNINGEVVPKLKKVYDHVSLVSGDDNNDAVMEMEPMLPINPEDFREDGHGEHFPQEHQEYRCNVCLEKIFGFRYRCCECEDYDMCSDCEYRGKHSLHYVLRVPMYRKEQVYRVTPMCEVRRVMAAVHLALAPPTDVKDELTIKIEDPGNESPPDPLDTEEAAPTDPEPMEDESTPTPLSCTDLTPPPANVPRVEPSKRSKPLVKLARTDKTAIPVTQDALKRKAIVRLNKLQLSLEENPVQTESLDEDAQRKQITNTYSARVTKKKTTDKASEYTRDFLQSTEQNIDHIIPTKHSRGKHVQSKRKFKTIDLLQKARKSEKVKILPPHVNSENIFKVEQTDHTNVKLNPGENIFVEEQTDDAIVEANAGDYIFIVEQIDDTIIKTNPSKNIFVEEQTDDALVGANPGENIFVEEQIDDAILEANSGGDIFVEEQIDDALVETKPGEDIFVEEQIDDDVFYMTQEEFNTLGKLRHNIC